MSGAAPERCGSIDGGAGTAAVCSNDAGFAAASLSVTCARPVSGALPTVIPTNSSSVPSASSRAINAMLYVVLNWASFRHRGSI